MPEPSMRCMSFSAAKLSLQALSITECWYTSALPAVQSLLCATRRRQGAPTTSGCARALEIVWSHASAHGKVRAVDGQQLAEEGGRGAPFEETPCARFAGIAFSKHVDKHARKHRR